MWHDPGMGQAPDPGTVVLVEDDTAIRDALCQLLARDGYQVHACATGAALLPAVVGADDYVVKPFLARELVARIRAHRRRAAASVEVAADVVVSGDVNVDLATREVSVAGVPVDLTAREFDLLAHLAASPRRVFSRDQLFAAVWGSSGDWQQEATVTEHVHRLRQKVGAARIATVRGVGYRFEPVDAPAHVAE